MKPSTALITSSRFPVNWPDDPDASPPPGREVAQAILDSLFSSGQVSLRSRTIDGDDHEHNMWFFAFDFEGNAYDINVAGALDNRTANTWRIDVTNQVGIFRALFGKRENYHLVPDDCLDLVAKSLCHVFHIVQVKFMTADEADREFYGIRHSGPIPRD